MVATVHLTPGETSPSRPEEHAWFKFQSWSAEWEAVPGSDDLFVSSLRSEFLVHQGIPVCNTVGQSLGDMATLLSTL